MPKAKPISVILTEQESNNFWKYVDKSSGLGPRGDCWEWRGSRTAPNPYGLFTVVRPTKRHVLLVHRLAYFLQRSNPNNWLVCHHCDNHPCVRGEHLFLGTYQDNKDDSVAKGRHFRGPRSNIENFKRGEETHWAKLSNEQVIEIVDLQKQGMNASQISRLGVY